MARLPEKRLERLKVETMVQCLAEGLGVVLQRRGVDWVGRCPFHDDQGPSLVINPETNRWRCEGACHAGGSVIEWVMRAEGVSFRHAVELLLAGYQPAATAVRRVPVGQQPSRSTVRKLSSALEASASDDRLLQQVIGYYHETLKTSPEALGYLAKRGIANAEAIDRFKLGFANRTLGYRLPMKNRKHGAALRGQLQRIGILRPTGHEHFNGSIVVPVIDELGRVTQAYGRKINDGLRKGTPLHLYLPGPNAAVWNAVALKAGPEVILCQSLIDALTFWCRGFRNVAASYGLDGFTEQHLAAFKANDTRRVLIAYGRDEEGNAAAERLAEHLLAAGLDAYRIEFPQGLDANDYACHARDASRSLGRLIRSASWLGKGDARLTTTATQDESEGLSSTAEETLVAIADNAEPAMKDAGATRANEREDTLLTGEPSVADLPAAAVPAGAQALVEAVVSESDIVVMLGNRRYRIRGLERNPGLDVLKLNLMVSGEALGETAVHVDTLDLYQSRPRAAFVRQAAAELGVDEAVVKGDVAKLLLKCEALQEERIRGLQAKDDETVSVSAADTAAAMELLQSPDLLQRIANDLSRCGLVGEDANKQVAYLAALSRKLERPLAVTIQSISAAGKSALMEAVLAFLPPEDRIQVSAMTGQSLYYMGETDLKHKVLALAEEEGASNAAYALKLLQSEGELTIASTGKDPLTGKLETHRYHVEGPVTLMLTTTAIDLDEELLSRCIVLSVDEGRSQTEAIHDSQRQRHTLAGLLARTDREAIRALHQNAGRLLQPLSVVNPHAGHLTFVADRTRTRRDHEKYLTLIDAIALLHQHQRVLHTAEHNGGCIQYVEVTLEDIAVANCLAHEVLGRTLDELPPQTRKLLHLLVTWVAERCAALALKRTAFRFRRRDVREATGWGNTQLKVHLHRLEELEYLLVHRGGRGQSFVYELLYDGDAARDAPHLSGLIDVVDLERRYDGERSVPAARRSGPETRLSAAGRREVRELSGGCRHPQIWAPGKDGKGSGRIDEDAASDDTVPASRAMDRSPGSSRVADP